MTTQIKMSKRYKCRYCEPYESTELEAPEKFKCTKWFCPRCKRMTYEWEIKGDEI